MQIRPDLTVNFKRKPKDLRHFNLLPQSPLPQTPNALSPNVLSPRIRPTSTVRQSKQMPLKSIYNMTPLQIASKSR